LPASVICRAPTPPRRTITTVAGSFSLHGNRARSTCRNQ
jgi:hypothetical protein